MFRRAQAVFPLRHWHQNSKAPSYQKALKPHLLSALQLVAFIHRSRNEPERGRIPFRRPRHDSRPTTTSYAQAPSHVPCRMGHYCCYSTSTLRIRTPRIWGFAGELGWKWGRQHQRPGRRSDLPVAAGDLGFLMRAYVRLCASMYLIVRTNIASTADVGGTLYSFVGTLSIYQEVWSSYYVMVYQWPYQSR